MNSVILVGGLAGTLLLMGVLAWILGRRHQETGTAPESGVPETDPDASGRTPAVSARESESMERSKLVIHGLLMSVHESVESLAGEMSGYNDTLTGHKAAIKKAMTVAALQEVERLMLSEVEVMQRATVKYRARLEEAEATIRRQQSEMQKLNADATVDFLTKVPNRRALDARLTEEMARFKRYGTPFSIVMLDVDFFKRINDKMGHIAGDRILRAVAGIALEQKRETDFLGRYGGEEFALLLPETPLKQAVPAAEKIRKKIEGARFNYEGASVKVTLSAGVAQAVSGDKEAAAILARADASLYRAKENGRNRVEASEES